MGKCFSIQFKNIFATLVDTSKLNGGLNQMILRCRFCLALFCLWLVGVFDRFIVCPHYFSASSYSNLVLLNISALEEFRDNLSLIIFVLLFLLECLHLNAISFWKKILSKLTENLRKSYKSQSTGKGKP